MSILDYRQHTKDELRFANRLLQFDRRHWDRRDASNIQPNNETEQALALIQTESHAFLRGIKSSVKEANLRAAGSLLRSLLESTANAHWITEDKSSKRAERYVAVTDNYSEYLDGLKTSGELRIPQETRSWTTSSVEHRIQALSPQAGMAWDYCSAFTHPSPTYMSMHPGLDKVLNYVISQANTYALTVRYIMRNNSTLFSEREADLLAKLAAIVLAEKLPKR